MFAGVVHTVKCIFKKHDIDLISEFVIIIIGMCIKEVIMQEFDHTSREDYTYTEQEISCPYFDNCYIQVRNQGACRYMCKDNPAYNKEVSK